MRNKERIAITKAKETLKHYRELGFARLTELAKKYGTIVLHQPIKVKGVVYPIVSLRYGEYKTWLTDQRKTGLLIGIDRSGDDGGFVKLPAEVDAISNIKNTLSLWELIEAVEAEL